jgi:hypothetical protein
MLCYLDHPLVARHVPHPDERRLPIRRDPGISCFEGNERNALIAGVPPPAPARPPRPRRRGRPLPPQPPALAPDLGVLERAWTRQNRVNSRASPVQRKIQILRWYWGLDGERVQTFTEIGRKLRISRARVAAIHAEMTTWLRKHPQIVIDAGFEMGLWDPSGQQQYDLLADSWYEQQIGGPMRWAPSR